jgi:peptidoglycan/LPS O-acetylase OafA/YrhL
MAEKGDPGWFARFVRVTVSPLGFTAQVCEATLPAEFKGRIMERNIEIDRLRAIAVIVTIYAHLDFVMLGDSPLYTATKTYIGPTNGVILFFAISGYVISKTLIPELDGATFKRNALAAFWIKRSARILPTSLLWIAIPLLLSASFNSRSMFGKFADNLPGAQAAALFYYNAFITFVPDQKSIFGPYWSLSLEEQFYALFPLFLLLLRGRSWRLAGLATAACAMILIPGAIIGFHADAILYGVIVYLISRPNLARTNVCKYAGWAATATLVFALVTMQAFVAKIVPGSFGNALLGLYSAALVWLAVRQRGWILPVSGRTHAAVDWIGTRSFGIYLIHIPAMMMAGEITWRLQLVDNPLGRGCIALGILAITTEICFRYIETPLRCYGRELAEKINSPSAGGISDALRAGGRG